MASEALRAGDLVLVRTGRGGGRFVCKVDGIFTYLQEAEPGTVKRIAGYGGCVMPAKPPAGVTVEKVDAERWKVCEWK